MQLHKMFVAIKPQKMSKKLCLVFNKIEFKSLVTNRFLQYVTSLKLQCTDYKIKG